MRSILILGFLINLFVFSQSGSTCKKVREGSFYYYPETKKQFKIIRDKLIQQEIFSQSSDTSFWKVSWINDCCFNLNFIRATYSMSFSKRQFYESHTITVQILEVNKSYYTFKAGIDSIANRTLIDTMWFQKKK